MQAYAGPVALWAFPLGRDCPPCPTAPRRPARSRTNAASGGVEMHPRRRPAAIVVGGGGVPSRCGRTASAFPRRGGLVVSQGVVGQGGRSRRGGADRLPPPLRVWQRRRLCLRLPNLPPGSYSFSFLQSCLAI